MAKYRCPECDTVLHGRPIEGYECPSCGTVWSDEEVETYHAAKKEGKRQANMITARYSTAKPESIADWWKR